MNCIIMFTLLMSVSCTAGGMHRAAAMDVLGKKNYTQAKTSISCAVINHTRAKNIDETWKEFIKNSKQADAWKIITVACADFGCSNSCKKMGRQNCYAVYNAFERAARNNAREILALNNIDNAVK